MFGWFFGKSKKTKFEGHKKAIGISIVGDPDFDDYGPTEERVAERLRGNNIISPEMKTAAIEIAPQYFRNGGSVSGCVKAIQSHGTPGTKDEIKELKRLLHLEKSRAGNLFSLRQMEDIGVTHCRFSSSHDERDTPLERKLDGKKMTIEQARQMVLTRSDEIPRGWFRSEIKF